MKGLRILGTGRCLPDRVVTNQEMTHMVDTSDEWIASRTGIRQRHFLDPGQSSADLASEAARRALDAAGIDPRQLGACVVATLTPDLLAPTMGCLVQLRLGLPEDMPCFDLNVGCSGFVYGLQVVRGLLAQSDKPYALLIGAEALSKITDYTDRSTCILFADGAGAVVLGLDETKRFDAVLGARGDPSALMVEGAGHPRPVIHMDGQAVFRFASEMVPRCIRQLLDRSGLTAADIDWVVPHQANRRIVEFAAKRLSLPMDRWFIDIDQYGNTSAASIPIALDDMNQRGLLKPGQKIICVGFGAGLTWGGALLEW